MAEASKPGEGAIVRADFGGGIDQSLDAWRVPPSQLADLTNGRLDTPGSVRKRYGYQTTTPPLNDAGAPIAALALREQTVVLDAARDNAIDDGASGSSASARILNECGYVARQYAPSSTNDWVTVGAVSDVIGDVTSYDAGAANFDDAFDIAATEDFVFVARITRAKQVTGATGTAVTLTVSQYDAQTRALIDSASTNVTGRVYPKILAYQSVSTLVVSVAFPDRTFGGFPGAVTPATVEFYTCTYAASGLGSLVTGYSSAGALDCDWWELTAFRYTTAERYRPLCPYDIASNGTSLFLAVYSSRTTTYRLQRWTVSAGSIALSAQANTAKIGALAVVAVSLELFGNRLYLGGVALSVNLAASLPWQPTAGVLQMHVVTTTGLALVSSGSTAIPLVRAGSCPVVGTVTVAQTLENLSLGYDEAAVFAELIQIDQTAPENVLARYVHHFSTRTDTGATVQDQNMSAATPTARAFRLTYFAKVAGTNRLPVRLPLGLGSSYSTWQGRDASNVLETEKFANYPGDIGTMVLTGPNDHRTTLASSPAQTLIPRLLPTAPPRPFYRGNRWHVPHRFAVDGSGGFAFAIVTLEPRAPGDALGTAYGASLQTAGGLVQTIDGQQAAETAIVDRPYIGSVRQNGGGVQVDFQDGDYLLQAVLAYRDAQGNVHRSAPSDPCRVTVSGAQDTWTIYHSGASYLNRDDATIEFYVTEPNGTILRRWTSIAASSVAGYGTTTIRDAGTLAATSLGLPDLDAPTIYTTGGVLPFVPVASARFAVNYRNRLLVGGADDPRSVYYSNAPVANQAPSFGVGNVIRMEHDGGCTAAGTLNDKLILFTESSVYAAYGQFRDETGAGSALSDPESIHDYIGCTFPASVVSIPPGLLFLGSDHIFYLIGERLDLQPIGLPVQDITSGQYPYDAVIAAVHIAEEREVRFYVQSSTAGAKQVLVYNYAVNQWSRDVLRTREDGTWTAATQSNAFGVLVCDNNTSNSRWIYDDRSTFFEFGNYLSMTAKTAWIQPGGSQDYARFRNCQFLGRSKADHYLAINVYTDFDEATVRATGSWSPAQLAPSPGSSWPEQVKLQVGSQKTQAVKITISDTDPLVVSTGEGPQLVGLAIEVLPLGGTKRLPAARKQ